MTVPTDEKRKALDAIQRFWRDSAHNIMRNEGRGEYVVIYKAQEDVQLLISTIEQLREELKHANRIALSATADNERLRSELAEKTNILGWIRLQCQAEHLEPEEIIRRIAEKVEPMSLYATINESKEGETNDASD